MQQSKLIKIISNYSNGIKPEEIVNTVWFLTVYIYYKYNLTNKFLPKEKKKK